MFLGARWQEGCVGSCGARSYAEGGDLATAGGNVGEAGGAEAGEEAAEFAAEEIGGEIDEHVAELDSFLRHDVGENLAANRDAFLHDPGAALFSRFGGAGLGGRNGALDGFVPVVLAGFPAEGDAGAAVFIVGLEHQVLAVCANERKEIDVLTVVRGAGVFDDAGPRNVAANELALLVRK